MLTDAGITKRGFSRWTVQHAIDNLGSTRADTLGLLADLDGLGHTTTENGVISVHTRCACVSKSLASAYEQKLRTSSKFANAVATETPEISPEIVPQEQISPKFVHARSRARTVSRVFKISYPTPYGSSKRSLSNYAGAYTHQEISESSTPQGQNHQAPAPGKIQGERRTPKRTSGSKNPHQLAIYFGQKLNALHYAERLAWTGGVPVEKLRKNFSRLVSEGITPEEIEQMIDVFLETPSMLNPNRSAWKTFLNKKEFLLGKVRGTGEVPLAKQKPREEFSNSSVDNGPSPWLDLSWRSEGSREDTSWREH